MPLLASRPRPRSVLLAAAGACALAACTAPPPPGPAPVTLEALEPGDRACYVVVATPAGERSLEGDFDLCPGGAHDASALIGRRVTYTTKKANVLAASCQGAPDCTESDEVDLVVTLQAAPH
jgi:hypothetical protein